MITAVVHTFNEEKTIERCLSSLEWVDEIIMVDMGSTDSTCKKANQFDAKVYQYPYTGFVEPARNFGIEKAKGKWIVILDADEEIPRTLAKQLLEASTDDSYSYYRIPRKNIIFGKWMKHTGWWPDFQVRFFQKGAVSWTDKIHSVPLTKGIGKELIVSEEQSITHYNYHTLEQFILRANRYSSIAAKELYIQNYSISAADLFEKPTKEFLNRFFIWEGYKDGFHGLALSFLQSVSELILYLKLWELNNFEQKKVSLVDIEKEIDRQYKQTKYWLLSERIKQLDSTYQKWIIKIRRRIAQYV